MTSSDLTQQILDRLRVVPRSIEELAEEIHADVGQVARAVNSLLRAGAIIKIEGRQVEGGPFYCLPDYTEPTTAAEQPESLRDYGRFYQNLDPLD